MKRIAPLPRLGFSWLAGAATVFFSTNAAVAQPPGAPGAPGEGLPWQVAVMFTANWVLAAVAVAILSRPSTKRTEKPKKTLDEEASA